MQSFNEIIKESYSVLECNDILGVLTDIMCFVIFDKSRKKTLNNKLQYCTNMVSIIY